MKLDKKYYRVIACFFIIIICGSVYLLTSRSEQKFSENVSDAGIFSLEDENLSSADEDTVTPKEFEGDRKKVYIHLCGEVKKPGVYQFEYEPRLVEVIKEAGGLTKKAAADSVNQAQIVTDGMQIVIASKKQVKKREKENSGSGSNSDSLVNLNTATQETLMTLTGIGEAKASMIIQYREENGGFKVKEDIMNISGIKEGVYNKIKDQIVV